MEITYMVDPLQIIAIAVLCILFIILLAITVVDAGVRWVKKTYSRIVFWLATKKHGE